MDKQQQPFYGTPLIRSLKNDDKDNESSSYKSRKARLDYQQTVRDSEGRQRFHGAFTGGFSAGYFNTVDTKEGFRPKEFVSHRSVRHGGASKVDHRPEDYMDEEDLSEFGIAPRKIRVNNIYSGKRTSEHGDILIRALQPRTESIGDKILDATSSSSSRRTIPTSKHVLPPPAKNNYHGIGYQPLTKNDDHTRTKSSNPLVAILGQGKRLKISGEAFGSGVLEDEDDLYVGGMNEVYDDINNYEFELEGASNRLRAKTKHLSADANDYEQDPDSLPGFTLAKDLSALNLEENHMKYPPPRIPDDWKAPTRSEPYVPPKRENPEQELFLQRLKTGTPLGDKFTSAIKPHISTDIDSREGLLHYSDIRTIRKIPESGQIDDQNISQPASISRQILEWRPCSLLCKRFNVPDPFPGSQFVGVRPSDLVTDKKHAMPNYESSEAELQHTAPMELRRSIFNVIFDEASNVIGNQPEQVCGTTDSEDNEDDEEAPQIVVLSSSGAEDDPPSPRIDTPDAEVIVLPQPRKEPEVIVLSSSSSSSSSSFAGESDISDRLKSVQQVDDDDPDAYGPALPPSLKTLISSNQGHTHRKSKKAKKKKKKKHKKCSR